MLDQRAVSDVQLLNPAGADDLDEETAAAPGHLHHRASAGSIGPGADLNSAAVHPEPVEERPNPGRVEGH
jgi:hypothetical protein